MTSDIADTPTPEFRAHLEWEIARTYRREARLGTRRSEVRRRRFRTGVIVAVCVALGTGSNFAAAQVRDVARRDSMLQAAQAELSLAVLRLDLARARFEAANRQVRAGMASADEAHAANADLQALQAQAARMQLNMAEIRAASQAPRDELNAPLVGGRDFVNERMQVDLMAAQERLYERDRTLAEIDRQVRVGTATQLARAQALVESARAKAALTVLAERDALRREFIEKHTPIDALIKREAATQVRVELQVARQALDLAAFRLKEAQKQRAAGAITELDVMRLELDLKEREHELRQLSIQLQRVGGGGGN